MPVEIRELVIRAIVSSDSESSQSQAPESQPVELGEREAIIEACVKQMMRILKKTKER